MRTCLTVMLAIILGGCARYQWFKDGITQEEANRDRYACMQESQQRVSSAYVGPYGGTSGSSVVTNVDLYNACIAARGYVYREVQ